MDMKGKKRKGRAYFVRIGFALPRPMAEELDRLLLRDGRRQGEFLRALVAQAIREARQLNSVSLATPPATPPAKRPAETHHR